MVMFSRVICCLSLLTLGSCQVYRSNFDCPPGEGVPCTSVTDIEKMIVETPDGAPDIFLGYLPSELSKNKKICKKSECLKQRKVWIEGKMQPCGLFIEGHYIYLKNGALQ